MVSVQRIILKRILKEFTENIHELIADTITAIATTINADKIELDFTTENKYTFTFYQNQEKLLEITIKTKNKNIMQKVKTILTETQT